MLPSEAMGRRIHVWCYGHFGAPIVVFPSAAGFAHEWEAHGVVEALAPLIDSGRIKLYCVESNVSEAWTDKEADPEWRIGRHQAYERFVLRDLVPFIYRDCHAENIPIAATGCSLGGFYAANFALKYPEAFRYALCMSGRYDATHFTNGFNNLEVYFSNPLAYVPNLEGEALKRVQQNTHLALVCGQGKWEEGCIEETRLLASLLGRQDIPHEQDIWGHDVSHDWEWWIRQARLHFGRRFGG
jgi:esterase/lipase superfamily enzyme